MNEWINLMTKDEMGRKFIPRKDLTVKSEGRSRLGYLGVYGRIIWKFAYLEHVVRMCTEFIWLWTRISVGCCEQGNENSGSTNWCECLNRLATNQRFRGVVNWSDPQNSRAAVNETLERLRVVCRSFVEAVFISHGPASFLQPKGNVPEPHPYSDS
jgi:hypothetical protein